MLEKRVKVLPAQEYQQIRFRAQNDPRINTGEGGFYRSLHLSEVDAREAIRVDLAMHVAEKDPVLVTRYLVCDLRAA